MASKSNPLLERSQGYEVSAWLANTPAELSKATSLGSLQFATGSIEVLAGITSLWGRLRWNRCEGGLLLRFAYAVSEIQVENGRDLKKIELSSPSGKMTVSVWVPDANVPLLRWRTTLVPSTDLLFPFWPRDIIPISKEDDPLGTQGTVFASQRGPKAAILYSTLSKPAAGSFLYMQDLTSLNDYCEQTETEPFGVVGGEWPEIGFQLPVTSRKPLQEGKPVVISDAMLALSSKIPADHCEAARLFIELYSRIYPHLQRPGTEYHDWLLRARETLKDLDQTPGCTTMRRGLRYLNAYHGLDKFPPESMVQLSVLVPMLDYASRRHEQVPLVEEIRANLASFYNPNLNTLVRYLPGDDFSQAREPQQSHDVMDSWYLYHTLLNAARLALTGDQEAKRLLLLSMPFAIKVARRFKYHWPIFYNLQTLEPIRKSVDERGYGETDVAGLYAHLMLHAFQLTDEKQYLDEAIRAADTLDEYGFEMAYQLNSTLYGAMALGGLWKRTGKTKYRELSFVCLCNVLVNCWMWECTYGHGDAYPTFFGLPPLQDGTYIAIYEESESVAAIASYLSGMGNDCPPGLDMLLNEYCKYLLHRSWYAFPTELPSKMIADKAKDGSVDRSISIPIEDLGGGRYAPGQVGQEVYGAGAPLIFAAFVYHEAAEGDFCVFCDYVSKESNAAGNRDRGELRLKIAGSAQMTARLRVVPLKVRRLPKVEAKQGRREILLKRVGRDLEGEIHGGEMVTVRWG